MNEDLGIIKIGVPTKCSACNSKLKYTGLGEYECIECGNLEYDDYGKVRKYLENHRGAMQAEVSRATGVPTNRIRQLLQEERIEVTVDSNVYLHCEKCGVAIRSGRRCKRCEEKLEKELEIKKKEPRVPANISGHDNVRLENAGEMRFIKK